MSTPIELYELTLKNFKSFGNNLTKLSFNQKKLTLILGKNLDASINGQIESNGSGKTTIPEALSYCLYDKTISKLAKDDLINNVNKKNMEVSVSFSKDGFFYRIVRFRKHKAFGGNGVAIYKGTTLQDVDYDNLLPENDIAQAGTADAQITELVGIPFDIFSRIIIFSAVHKPFLDLPSSSTSNKENQRDIIEELVGITEISNKADILKKQLSSDKAEYDTLVKVEDELNKQKQKFSEQMESMKAKSEKWESDKLNELANIDKSIKKLSSIDFDGQLNIFKELFDYKKTNSDLLSKKSNLVSKANTLQSTIKKIETWDDEHDLSLSKKKNIFESFPIIDYNEQTILLNKISDLETENKSFKKDIDHLNKVTLDTSSQMSALADKIEHLEDNKCPFCMQKYEDAYSKIKEIDIEKTEIAVVYEKAMKDRELLISKLEKNRDNIEELSKNVKFSSLKELNDTKSAYDKAKILYESCLNEVNPYKDENIQSIKDSLNQTNDTIILIDNSLLELKTNIDRLSEKLSYNSETEIERDKTNLENYKINYEKCKTSINPYTDTINEMASVTINNSNAEKIRELDKIINHKTLLYKLLTKPDSFIRKSILSDRLQYLNKQLKYYLDILGLPHSVHFTEELEAKISQFNNPLEYNNLSSGQKARVNIALAFAFRDVLQQRYGKINLCILDECLDVGLSNVGVSQAVTMIKKVAKDNNLSMFVISHRDEIVSSFNDVMEIELSNGFSTIIQ